MCKLVAHTWKIFEVSLIDFRKTLHNIMMMYNMKVLKKIILSTCSKNWKIAQKHAVLQQDLKFFFKFQKSSQKVCLMCASTPNIFGESIWTKMMKFYNIVMINKRHISKKLIWNSTENKQNHLTKSCCKTACFWAIFCAISNHFFDMCLLCIITIL